MVPDSFRAFLTIRVLEDSCEVGPALCAILDCFSLPSAKYPCPIALHHLAATAVRMKENSTFARAGSPPISRTG